LKNKNYYLQLQTKKLFEYETKRELKLNNIKDLLIILKIKFTLKKEHFILQ